MKKNNVLMKASLIASQSQDFSNVMTNICSAWSEDNCSNYKDTYDWLVLNRPDDENSFISMLTYLVNVSSKGGDNNGTY